MDYQKLFQYAQLSIESCIQIEKTQIFESHPMIKELMASMTPEERNAAVEFVGKTNELRIECKRKYWKD